MSLLLLLRPPKHWPEEFWLKSDLGRAAAEGRVAPFRPEVEEQSAGAD